MTALAPFIDRFRPRSSNYEVRPVRTVVVSVPTTALKRPFPEARADAPYTHTGYPGRRRPTVACLITTRRGPPDVGWVRLLRPP